jgi:hypothetical protein
MRTVTLLVSAFMTSSILAAPEMKMTLLDLAKKNFAGRNLTVAEHKLFAASEKSERVSVHFAGDDQRDDPANAANWPDERVIHAECLVWLCTTREASALISHRGIRIVGLRIDGDLNLDAAQVAFPVSASKCAFQGDILLRDARLQSLHLLNCVAKRLDARGSQIEVDVDLDDFKADGEVRFEGATIGGTLACNGAHLTNPKGYALIADHMKIGGSVLLRKGFQAEGEVRFPLGTIGGVLDCSAAQLTNRSGMALDARGVKINGSVFFHGFKAEGGLNLRGATIGGDFECGDVQLTIPKGQALWGDAAKINGNLGFLNSKIDGEVSFKTATVGGNLECFGTQFSNPDGYALIADGARIGGVVSLVDGFKADGEVRFPGATIGGNLQCSAAQLSNRKGEVLAANGVKITGNVIFRNGFTAEGEVNVLGATIGGNLQCSGGVQFSNPGGYALCADGVKIDNVFLRDHVVALGEVRFPGATIGGHFECDGVQLTNPGGIALLAEGAKIGRSVFLRNGFKADGKVTFASAEVGSYFQWQGISSPQNSVLDFRSANVAVLWDEKRSWPGILSLDGFVYFVYNRIHEAAPIDAANRLQWLRRQPRGAFLPQPYEQLASVLRNMGHEREARKVMIAKNEDQAEHTRWFSQEWWWYNVFGKLIGYGYQPWRAFLISAVMIVIGCALFHLGYERGVILPSKESAYAKTIDGQYQEAKGKRVFSREYPTFNAFVYSLESFTPLLKLDQSANWAPNANRGTPVHLWRFQSLTTWGSLLRIYLWFHIIAGWVLTSLWIGAVTGLVKT